jgi:preprotein translocase SecE subunit
MQSAPGQPPGQPLNRLAVGSLAGTVYVLGSIATIFYALPNIWNSALSAVLASSPAVNAALLILAMIGAAFGLLMLGLQLLGSSPPHGMRAGIFCGLVGVFLVGLLTRGIGGILESILGPDSPAMGLGLMGVVGLVLFVLTTTLFFRKGFGSWVETLEDQGWFTTAAYKRTQGQRVRRGTMLAILVLAGCGVYTMLSHGSLRSGASTSWGVRVPFTGGQILTLLPDVQFTVPILVTLAALWFAYRFVNFPTFADFLIATEAEVNKVSWTTRKRLVQDTIVVLTTMVLITVFLFVVDLIWFWTLSHPWIQVLQTDQTSLNKQLDEQDY